jgi:hypothetical protein
MNNRAGEQTAVHAWHGMRAGYLWIGQMPDGLPNYYFILLLFPSTQLGQCRVELGGSLQQLWM